MADKPANKFRIGLVTATIWKNTAEGDLVFYTVNLQNSYRDGEGKWVPTDNFKAHELLNAAKVLERAEAWIAEQ